MPAADGGPMSNVAVSMPNLTAPIARILSFALSVAGATGTTTVEIPKELLAAFITGAIKEGREAASFLHVAVRQLRSSMYDDFVAPEPLDVLTRLGVQVVRWDVDRHGGFYPEGLSEEVRGDFVPSVNGVRTFCVTTNNHKVEADLAYAIGVVILSDVFGVSWEEATTSSAETAVAVGLEFLIPHELIAQIVGELPAEVGPGQYDAWMNELRSRCHAYDDDLGDALMGFLDEAYGFSYWESEPLNRVAKAA